MNIVLQLNKLDAARCQIHAAINIVFTNGDIVAAHTLAGAAATLLTDLVKQKIPEKSWDSHAQNANEISAKDYFRIMRHAQNYLKHAEHDANEVLELNPADTESLLFMAIMNLGELLSHDDIGMLSTEESIYQLWYIACQSPELEGADAPFSSALEIFGDMGNLSRADQISAGRRELRERLNENAFK